MARRVPARLADDVITATPQGRLGKTRGVTCSAFPCAGTSRSIVVSFCWPLTLLAELLWHKISVVLLSYRMVKTATARENGKYILTK